ncbi:hypothetical protein EJ07DRAFT_173502 [Lizonia empirigonia]|nr:hypothetical protein EJ07DRAFT_173502 [Lizonia empirigonia]
MKVAEFLVPASLLALATASTDAHEAFLSKDLSVGSQVSSKVPTDAFVHSTQNKRNRREQDELGGVHVAESVGILDAMAHGSISKSQPDGDFSAKPYPTGNKYLTEAIAPAQTIKTSQKLRSRVMDEFYLIALQLVDWVVPIVLLLSSALLVTFMYKSRYNNGLLLGAGATGSIFARVQSDPSAPAPLLIVVVLAYLLFHVTYCRAITRILRLGDGFAASASITAMVFLTGLSQVSGLSTVWTESTGLAGIWSFLPIHLMAFFASAVIVKMVRTYMRQGQDDDPLLPVSTRDVDDAVSISRLVEVPESRLRMVASSNAVI